MVIPLAFEVSCIALLITLAAVLGIPGIVEADFVVVGVATGVATGVVDVGVDVDVAAFLFSSFFMAEAISTTVVGVCPVAVVIPFALAVEDITFCIALDNTLVPEDEDFFFFEDDDLDDDELEELPLVEVFELEGVEVEVFELLAFLNAFNPALIADEIKDIKAPSFELI